MKNKKRRKLRSGAGAEPGLIPFEFMHAAHAREFPGLYKWFPGAIERAKSFGNSWPSWCYAPMWLIEGGFLRQQRGSTYPANVDAAYENIDMTTAIGYALSAWRVTQGVYRFDPALLDALWDTPLTGRPTDFPPILVDGEPTQLFSDYVPADLFQRLPEWCVYIETERMWKGLHLHGFFATATVDFPFMGAGLLLVMILRNENGKPAISGCGLSLAESIDVEISEELGSTTTIEPQIERVAGQAASSPHWQAHAPLVSLLLYLCSEEPEWADRDGRAEEPGPPAMKKNKKGEAFRPLPKRPVVWETGKKIGAALRQAQERGSSGRSPSGHVRRAHWHSYWTGPRDKPEERKLKLRWLSPMLINTDHNVEPRLREVR